MLYLSVTQARRALANEWRWQSFHIAELACKCSGRYCRGQYWHAPRFLDHLQGLRDRLGKPLIVRSGHRCTQWNAQVGGAPKSQHKRIAVDLALHGHDRMQLYAAAREIGFTGFGLARSFIHLDLRAQAAKWYYHGSKELWTMSWE